MGERCILSGGVYGAQLSFIDLVLQVGLARQELGNLEGEENIIYLLTWSTNSIQCSIRARRSPSPSIAAPSLQ